MKKFLILSLFSIVTLHAMQELSDGISIAKAEEKDIPAMTALHDEVTKDFFKPMYSAYADYGEEVIEQFFREVDSYMDEFFVKATSKTESNHSGVFIVIHKDAPDKVFGLCGVTRDGTMLFIDYIIISQQLRGKGIGKMLLNKVLELYDDIAICRLYTPARNNHATQAFYEKFGFTSTKEPCSFLPCMPNTHYMYQLDIKK